MYSDNYGMKVKKLRTDMGLTQNEVAQELDVTPGYICNVENGRTAMSLRVLIYYAKRNNISLDSLVENLEPSYEPTALDHELMEQVANMDTPTKKKLLQTLKTWNRF